MSYDAPMKLRRSRARDALQSAACGVLAKNPGASLEVIAAEAGVGRATLYRHFGSRDGLIHALALQAIRETDEAVSQIPQALDATEMLRRTVEVTVPLGDRFHFLSGEFEAFRDPELKQHLERQLRELQELVEAVKAEGRIAPEVPTAWVVASLDTLIYAAWQSVSDGQIARQEAPALVFRTLLEGLGPKRS